MKINVYDMTLLTPKHAGERLGLGACRMGQLVREEKIRAIRSSDGTHLFLPEDVERLRRDREAAKEARV